MDIIMYVMLAMIAICLFVIWGLLLTLCWAMFFPNGKVSKWLFSDYPKGGGAAGSNATNAAAASIIVTSSFTR